MHISAHVQVSTRKDKKLMVDLTFTSKAGSVRRKRVHFGGVRRNGTWYDDFTTGGDRDAYLKRHATNEDWSLSGIESAGFWSRWVLWEGLTYAAALRALSRQTGIHVVNDIGHVLRT